jgi:uncharacterized protein YndB with AHSA1/START domain
MTVSSPTLGAFGTLSDPTTLRIERLLPGPIERVWSYLTDSELRRQWLAAGDMSSTPGSGFELVWRNNELSNPPGTRPANFGDEHRMQCRVLECSPPTRLAFTWGVSAEVHIELAEHADGVRLVLTHLRVTERAVLLNVSAGWHAHLDVLLMRLRGEQPTHFWDHWSELKQRYEARLP